MKYYILTSKLSGEVDLPRRQKNMNSLCGERRSHQRLISTVGLFPAIWRLFLYWISTRLHLFNTNMKRWHQLKKKTVVEWLVESETKTSAVNWQHANFFFFFLNSMSPGSSHPLNQRGAKPLTGDFLITVPSSVTFKFWKLWPTFICTA